MHNELENIINNNLTVDIVSTNNIELIKEVQTILSNSKFYNDNIDGIVGNNTTTALAEFKKSVYLNEPTLIGVSTAKALLNNNATPVAESFNTEIPKKNMVDYIVDYMLEKGYVVTREPDEINIVYIEGVNNDLSLNDDAPNIFNDQRLVIQYVKGYPTIVGQWEATTEPGRYYTENPMNPEGAARIKFGQYKAWAVGIHGNSQPHEALVQVAPITVYRDKNKDYSRSGDAEDTGLFGVNQHWGGDAPINNVGRWSAGCLVGMTREGHREFMNIVKSDSRYKKNRNYVFYTTIISGDELGL